MKKASRTFSAAGAALFLLSLVYLGLELLFNVRLLDVASSVHSDPGQVDQVQHFGRAVSGFGFTLLVLGVFQRFGFRLGGWRAWLAFAAVAALCLVPFFLTLEPVLALAAFFGIALTGVSRGRVPALVTAGLVMLAWPAMFSGQKLAVERLVVTPTTAQERLNANYILLVKAGIEECVVTLEETPLCGDDPSPAGAEMRATRALLGPLFMIDPGALFGSLAPQQGRIIDSLAARGYWFSPQEYYQRYLRQVADERARIVARMDEQYYLPYKQASDLYQVAAAPEKLKARVAEASAAIEARIEQGWQLYQRAMDAYRSATVNGAVMAGRAAGLAQGAYARFCRGARCQNALSRLPSEADVLSQTKQAADQRFFEETGYMPGLADRAEFVAAAKTQNTLRAEIEARLRQETGDDAFTLPEGWSYQSDDFPAYLSQLLRRKARQDWNDKVRAHFNGDLPPGLGRESFYAALGLPPLPALEDLTVSESEFMQKYVIPLNRKIADEALEKIRSDAPHYAEGDSLAEQGKDYVRVLYIPAIALCVSLVIVVLTLGRYLAQAAALLAPPRWRGMARLCAGGGFLLAALVLPYAWPNPYTASTLYQKYYRVARGQAPVAARLLDWVVHAQPLVYRAGRTLVP